MKSTTLGLTFFAAILAASPAVADEHDEGITLNYPDKLEWKDGPPSLPKGAKIAILEGDPSKEGPFVSALLPDGYRITRTRIPRWNV
jgi:hypothetical protein